MKLALAVIVINLLQTIISSFDDTELSWYAWDYALITSGLLLSIDLFRKSKYRLYRQKASYLSVMFMFIWTFIDYTSLAIFPNENLSNSIAIVTLLIFFIFLLRTTVFAIKNNSATYSGKGTYIIYKIPTNINGLLTSLWYAPYSTCSIVIDGERYKYKSGEIVRTRHRHRSGIYFYKKIGDLASAEADKLVGMKFSYRHNCFRVFGRPHDYVRRLSQQ